MNEVTLQGVIVYKTRTENGEVVLKVLTDERGRKNAKVARANERELVPGNAPNIFFTRDADFIDKNYSEGMYVTVRGRLGKHRSNDYTTIYGDEINHSLTMMEERFGVQNNFGERYPMKNEFCVTGTLKEIVRRTDKYRSSWLALTMETEDGDIINIAYYAYRANQTMSMYRVGDHLAIYGDAQTSVIRKKNTKVYLSEMVAFEIGLMNA